MTEQKRPEISIIVAVYKGEKYLNGCVDAILNQTFRDFEVILVDDGSPDNCPAMCDAIAKRDSRVRVIHQKNKGVDGAKNAGIDSARGNWIGFVDQDDLIDKTYYEKLYHAAQQAGAEIAVSNILYMEADGSASVYKDLPLRDEVVKANRFLDGKDYEDAFMSSAILEQINKVACLAEPLYHFRINPQSVTHRKIILKNLDEIEANYRMLQCTMKYGQKDAAYLQYAVMKGYFKKIMKNLPPEDRNDPKVQQTIDLIRKAETEVRQAGADTLRNKLEAAVWFWNKTVYYHLKGWA